MTRSIRELRQQANHRSSSSLLQEFGLFSLLRSTGVRKGTTTWRYRPRLARQSNTTPMAWKTKLGNQTSR